MPRPSHREKILTEGLKVLQERGFAGSSVRDIIRAAGVPQGSFTNHFSSKEAFGIEVLNVYYAQCSLLTERTLLNDSLPPLSRLKRWIDGMLGVMNVDGHWDGCLLGNLGAERSDGTEQLQTRLREVFLDLQAKIAYCLKAAVRAGELPVGTDAKGLAAFIHASLEGAVLSARAVQSRRPMEVFRKTLFDVVLRQQGE